MVEVESRVLSLLGDPLLDSAAAANVKEMERDRPEAVASGAVEYMANTTAAACWHTAEYCNVVAATVVLAAGTVLVQVGT